ncbi:MAG: prephenate dehydrogenase/arogenate dehydrogenase family protein [Thermodesulfobacteriota bacterium]
MDSVTIGIIGGTGGMGRWFEKYFTDCGHRVLIAGRKTALTYHDLARQCRVVAISTPLNPALEIIESIGPALREDQLLVDFCSQKEAIVARMAAATRADVIGTHPMFAPNTPSLQGLNVIVCPARDLHGWLPWLEGLFAAGGGVVTRMDPAEHDRKMAMAQSLMHFLTLSLGRMLQHLEVTPQEAFLFATPIFRINVDLIGRLFSQDITLYAELVRDNRHAPEMVRRFSDAMEETRRAFAGKDMERTLSYMKSIGAFFGKEFCDQALTETTRALSVMYQK